MQNNIIETKIRDFLVDDMVKENVRAAASDDELDLDSLDQTELRVYLDEEFGIKFSNHPDAAPFTSIQSIVDFIGQHAVISIS